MIEVVMQNEFNALQNKRKRVENPSTNKFTIISD